MASQNPSESSLDELRSLVLPLQASGSTGLKLTVLYGAAGNSSQQTIYLQGDRRRTEYRNSFGQTHGPRLVSVTRCDLGQFFELNLDSSEYTSAPYPPKPLTQEEIEQRGLQTSTTYVSDKPTLRIEVTTTDTGERKEIFGRIARHVVTTRKQIPLEGSHSEPHESVTDGWYIDLDRRLSCERDRSAGRKARGYLALVKGKQPIEKPEFVTIGEPEIGFALHSRMTSKGTCTLPDGTKKQVDSKSETLVTQLEEGSLDPALFEIPPGFKHEKHIKRYASAPSIRMKDFWRRTTARLARLLNR
jgi:hypothetical protein